MVSSRFEKEKSFPTKALSLPLQKMNQGAFKLKAHILPLRERGDSQQFPQISHPAVVGGSVMSQMAPTPAVPKLRTWPQVAVLVFWVSVCLVQLWLGESSTGPTPVFDSPEWVLPSFPRLFSSELIPVLFIGQRSLKAILSTQVATWVESSLCYCLWF